MITTVLVIAFCALSVYGHFAGFVSLLLCRADAQRSSTPRHEFEQLSAFARKAMKTALDLDARVRVLEGRPPRPDSTVDPIE